MHHTGATTFPRHPRHNRAPVRLNKHISESGICSRREADAWIAAGRVTVNGARGELGTQVKPGDAVLVDGAPLPVRRVAVYLALNKPRGVTCTTERDVAGNIVDFVGHAERIFPIGRLDKDSEGLILLTNDGDIVNEVLREEHGHEKEYLVTVEPEVTANFLAMMAAGVRIGGEKTKPAQGHARRPEPVPDRAHAGTQPPGPPHVFGARLAGEAAGARTDHAHPARRAAERALARPLGSRVAAAPRYTCACQKALRKRRRRRSRN